MAAKRETGAAVAAPAVQKISLKSRLLRWGMKLLLVLVLLLLLAGGAFYGLVQMKILDPEEQVQKAGLQDNRIVRAALEKMQAPQTVEVSVVPDKEEPSVVRPQTGAGAPGGAQPAGAAALPPTVAPIDTAERDRLEKLRQQEEKKRISKLARLYEGMKPAEAVAILTKLDDDTIVALLNRMEEDNAAKMLAAFEPARAANLSEALLRNRPGQTLIPQQN